MRRMSAAHRKAIDYLRERVAEGQTRLPPIVRLAGDAGVSARTMWRAVGELRQAGVLRVAPRRGIEIVGGLPAASSAPLQRRNRADELTDTLAREFATGRMQPGSPLPQSKQLQARFSCSAATVRGAVQRLAGDGFLERRGRWYSVRKSSGVRRNQKVLLILRARQPGTMFVPGDTRRLVATLEDCCSKHELGLIPFPYGFFMLQPTRYRAHIAEFERLLKRDDILGTLIFTAAMHHLDVPGLVARVRQRNRPVALLTADDDRHMVRPADHGVRTFLTANSHEAGREMGRYLLQRGHRRVAYLDSHAGARWSSERKRGLHDVLNATGLPPPSYHSAESSVSSEPEPPAQIDRKADMLLRGAVSRITNDHVDRNPLLGDIRDSVAALWKRALSAQQMHLLFERAATDRRATAWVCDNDGLAIHALEYLRDRRIAVPGRIAVAGFDNSFEGFLRGLTSYSFNAPAAVEAMLAFILNDTAPDYRRARARFPRMDGFVAARDSA